MFIIKGINKDVFYLFLSYKFQDSKEINFFDRKNIVNSAKKIIKNLVSEVCHDGNAFKPSMYNISVPSGNGWLIYNTHYYSIEPWY